MFNVFLSAYLLIGGCYRSFIRCTPITGCVPEHHKVLLNFMPEVLKLFDTEAIAFGGITPLTTHSLIKLKKITAMICQRKYAL
jgi:hypothetical protein